MSTPFAKSIDDHLQGGRDIHFHIFIWANIPYLSTYTEWHFPSPSCPFGSAWCSQIAVILSSVSVEDHALEGALGCVMTHLSTARHQGFVKEYFWYIISFIIAAQSVHGWQLALAICLIKVHERLSSRFEI